MGLLLVNQEPFATRELSISHGDRVPLS